jgi:hypothetical protein
MKNSEILMYFGGIIASFLGMLIHIRYMIDTDKPIHLVCVLLWTVMCICLVTILKRGIVK